MRLAALALALLWACAPGATLPELQLPYAGAAVVALVEDGELVDDARLIDDALLLGLPSKGAIVSVGNYRLSAGQLGLSSPLVRAPGRGLPWPSTWFDLDAEEAAWRPRGDGPPPAWAREFTVGPHDLAPCAALAWSGARARGAVVAAAPWPGGVLLAEAGTSIVVVRTRDGYGAEKRLRFPASELVAAPSGGVLANLDRLLYRVRPQGDELAVAFENEADISSLSRAGDRVLYLGKSPRRVIERGADDRVVRTTTVSEGADRVWAVPSGAVVRTGTVVPMGPVGVVVVARDSGALGPLISGAEVASIDAVTHVGNTVIASARTGTQLLLLELDEHSTTPSPWRWHAVLERASDAVALAPYAGGVLIAGTHGISRYAPDAGECVVELDIAPVEVLLMLEDGHYFVAGRERGSVNPRLGWLDLR